MEKSYIETYAREFKLSPKEVEQAIYSYIDDKEFLGDGLSLSIEKDGSATVVAVDKIEKKDAKDK